MNLHGAAATLSGEANALTETPEIRRLLTMADPQGGSGHLATLTEILQQPETWRTTAAQMQEHMAAFAELVSGVQMIVLTGSGSSEYAGECVRAALRRRLQCTVQSVGAGALLTDGLAVLPVERPGLMISLGRSGDSPESVGALALMLELDPSLRQLAVTCNAEGQLSKASQKDQRIHVVVLDERTNDRSLVMTSSFTNMALASLALGWTGDAAEYAKLAGHLSDGGMRVLQRCFETLPAVSRGAFQRVVYLANISHQGAAREAALKMTEMTAGRVMATCETYLGLRHGPMSAIDDRTLIVCFLSSDALVRAYETDLIQELKDKSLGMQTVLIGSRLPSRMMAANDVAIEDQGFDASGPEFSTLLYVLPGQVLAYYRCLHEGLTPDAPSQSGVINRVVQSFTLRGAAARHFGKD